MKKVYVINDSSSFDIEEKLDIKAGPKETPASKNLSISRNDDNIGYRLGYYVGFVGAKLEEDNTSIGERSTEQNETGKEVFIRGKCRFPDLDICKMLEEVKSSTEYKIYLETGKKNGNTSESLYTINYEEKINLTELVNDYAKWQISKGKSFNDFNDTDNEMQSIKHEFEKLLEFEKKETIKRNDYEIWPYAINMALLFELYSREYVKKNVNAFTNDNNFEMLEYVPDKANINDVESTEVDDYVELGSTTKMYKGEAGARTICVKSDGTPESNDFYFQGTAVPDIVLKKKGSEKYVILDVKYKDPTDRQDRDDRLQILAYAFLFEAEQIGHIFPANGRNEHEKVEFTVESEKEIKYKMFYIK